MKTTDIQWCHSTINPVMGCDGCELWKPASAIRARVVALVLNRTPLSKDLVAGRVDRIFGGRATSEVYRDRNALATEMMRDLQLDWCLHREVVDVMRAECKCYAGLLGTNRAGHKGYADQFEIPKLYAGRVAEAANWGLPLASEVAAKPWLADCRRLIFISDMGDALSTVVPFAYLKREIIDNVTSIPGRRHMWLWLTKRPARMAEFGQWLATQSLSWPDNLVAMTTVTAQRFAARVDELRRVPAKYKGLSIEPLFEPVDLDLSGINWVIVGGGSDVLANPFHAEWALDLQTQAGAYQAAFFLKQLGKQPYYRGQPLKLNDRHGGDWDEWPTICQTRQLPSAFKYEAIESSLELVGDTD